jgi:replicative DNA helicase
MTPQFDTNVDKLSKYGTAFQSKVLASLLSSREFLQQSLDVLNPNFFDSDASQWIVKQTIEYFAEYKVNPTLEVFKLELDKEKDDVLKIAVKDQLKSAFQRKNDDDLEYVKDKFLDFAKNQALKVAIFKSADLLEVGRYDEIKKVVDQAMRAGQPRNIGHSWKDDIAIRLTGVTRNTVPTGWDAVDVLLGGGLGGGELGVIAAPSGIGKSWALATIGANAARLGKRVVYYTLELNENYVGLRYDTIFTGIEPGNIPKHPTIVQDMVDEITGDIIIKYYPARSINVHTLRAHLENLTANKRKPDLLLIDYADLMRSIDRADARYQELGAIYEEIRGMAGELDIPVWTASQTQRSSIQDDVIQADKIAESYSKIMTADVVMSLSRKLEDKANHTGRAHLMKNRFGSDGVTLPMYMNTSQGKIEIFDESSSKGILLKKQMQQGESLLKKNLVDKFKQKFNGLDDDFSEE